MQSFIAQLQLSRQRVANPDPIIGCVTHEILSNLESWSDGGWSTGVLGPEISEPITPPLHYSNYPIYSSSSPTRRFRNAWRTKDRETISHTQCSRHKLFPWRETPSGSASPKSASWAPS